MTTTTSTAAKMIGVMADIILVAGYAMVLWLRGMLLEMSVCLSVLGSGLAGGWVRFHLCV
jgi:hypothetical protein